MSNITKCSDYTIRIATTEDKQGLLCFINKFFFLDEPLNEALVDLGEDADHISENFLDNIDEGISFLAMSNSNEIIGFIQNSEVTPNSSYGIEYDNETDLYKKQILKLLDHMEGQIDLLAKLQNTIDKEFEVKTLTVHSGWRKQGLGRKLLKNSIELARQKGFIQMRSTCTSAFSAQLFTSCGFGSIYTLKYEDWKNEGHIDFLPHHPHSYAKGMLLKF